MALPEGHGVPPARDLDASRPPDCYRRHALAAEGASRSDRSCCQRAARGEVDLLRGRGHGRDLPAASCRRPVALTGRRCRNATWPVAGCDKLPSSTSVTREPASAAATIQPAVRLVAAPATLAARCLRVPAAPDGPVSCCPACSPGMVGSGTAGFLVLAHERPLVCSNCVPRSASRPRGPKNAGPACGVRGRSMGKLTEPGASRTGPALG